MGNALRQGFKKFLAYFLGATLLALYFFTEGLMQARFGHDPTPWWELLLLWLIGMYIFACLLPGVLWLGRRFPIERRNWGRRIALHLVFSFVFTIVDLALCSIAFPLLGIAQAMMKTFWSAFAILLVVDFHNSIVTYWVVLCAQYAVTYYRRYQERQRDAIRLELHASELKTQLVRAQLSSLKMQLQPHFLFNTLNAIMVLVRQQKGRQAEEMLGRLGDLLRCVLEDVDAQEVSLRRELECLQIYLSIEQVRFQDRLRVEIQADQSVLDAAVPQMGLQPIVENAIRHGIGRRSAAGHLRISAARIAESLHIQVADDGPGLSPSSLSGGGIGLPNTRARLHQLYGDAAQLTMENGEQGGALVTMILPFHVAPADSDMELMEVHAFHGDDR